MEQKVPQKNPPSLPYDPLNLPIHNNSTNITIKASSGLTIRRLTARKKHQNTKQRLAINQNDSDRKISRKKNNCGWMKRVPLKAIEKDV